MRGCGVSQRVEQQFRIFAGQAKDRLEQVGLVLAVLVVRIDAIVRDFARIDPCLVAIRQLHSSPYLEKAASVSCNRLRTLRESFISGTDN